MLREETEEVERRLTRSPEGPDVRVPRQCFIAGHSKELHLRYHRETPVVKEEEWLRERDTGVMEEDRLRLRCEEAETPRRCPGPKLMNTSEVLQGTIH